MLNHSTGGGVGGSAVGEAQKIEIPMHRSKEFGVCCNVIGGLKRVKAEG